MGYKILLWNRLSFYEQIIVFMNNEINCDYLVISSCIIFLKIWNLDQLLFLKFDVNLLKPIIICKEYVVPNVFYLWVIPSRCDGWSFLEY